NQRPSPSRSPAVSITSALRIRGCTDRSSSSKSEPGDMRSAEGSPAPSAGRWPRQVHSEQWGGRLRRQFRVSLRNFEKGLVLVADFDVAQLPVDRRDLPAFWLEPAIAFHGNAVAAEPERAGD